MFCPPQEIVSSDRIEIHRIHRHSLRAEEPHVTTHQGRESSSILGSNTIATTGAKRSAVTLSRGNEELEQV